MIAFNNLAKYSPSGLYHSSFSLKYYCHHELLNCHQGCFTEKGIVKSFAKFTGKYLCQSLFLIQLRASGRVAISFKKSPWHRCLQVSFEKFLRPPFYRTPSLDHFWIVCSPIIEFLFFLNISMLMLFCGVSYSSLYRENDICSLYFCAKTKPVRAHFLENFFLKQIITPLLPKGVWLYTTCILQ